MLHMRRQSVHQAQVGGICFRNDARAMGRGRHTLFSYAVAFLLCSVVGGT